MFNFFNDLDPDLREALIVQLRNLWTHTSTAIEGNTLALGETAFVFQEGLTISGKPLKDHQEVVGHARAIDLLHDCLQKGKVFSESGLFALHKAVQTEVMVDVGRPVGDWKKEPLSTHCPSIISVWGRSKPEINCFRNWKTYGHLLSFAKKPGRQRSLLWKRPGKNSNCESR